MRSCSACVELTKVAPNCGCAADETWDAAAGACDGEVEPETETPAVNPPASTPAPVQDASANILKFVATLLVALICLF